MSEILNDKSQLAIYDIDGTLIEGESQKYFLTYLFKKGHLSPVVYARILIWFIFYKTGFAKDPRVPLELVLLCFIDWDIKKIDDLARDFVRSCLRDKFYPEIQTILQADLKASLRVVLVSNAIEPITKAIADLLGVREYLCTQLERNGRKLTGRIFGNIVYGVNKREAVLKYSELNGYDLNLAHAYADHLSDRYLLKSIGHPTVVNPTWKMLRLANRSNWPIIFTERYQKSSENDTIA